MKKKIIALALFIFAFLLYANTIPNDYNLDDEFVTNHNPQISKGVSAIPEILTTFYQTDQGFTYGYRPVVKITYAVEYSVFGWNPHVSHAINALLYALLILIVFIVSKRIFERGNILLPLFTTLIFMVHPSHTEVVASLKNRDELLAVLFGFLSILFFIKSTTGNKLLNSFIGGLFLLLGLFSKMSVLPLVVLIPMILFLKRPVVFSDNRKGNLKTIFKSIMPRGLSGLSLKTIPHYLWVMLGLVLAAGIFGAMSRLLPSSPAGTPEEYHLLYWQNPLYFDRHFSTWVLTCGETLWFYLKLMVFPFNLAFYYGFNMIPVSVGDPIIWISLIIHAAGMIIAGWLLMKSRNIAAFGFLFYLISLSMFANLFAPVAGIVAERLSFLASWGFSVMIAYLILKLLKIDLHGHEISRIRFLILLAVALFIIIPFTVMTLNRNTDWKDHQTLFTADIEKLEYSAKANDLMAASLFREAQQKIRKNAQDPSVTDLMKKAVLHYQRCASVYPDHYKTWNNMGLINVNFLKNIPEAIDDFKNAVQYKPDFIEGWNNLGFAYFISGKYTESVASYQKAIELKPESADSWSSLANVYFKAGDRDQAKKINEKLMTDHPASPLPYINLATYALVEMDTTAALGYFNQALSRDPSNPVAGSFVSTYQKPEMIK